MTIVSTAVDKSSLEEMDTLHNQQQSPKCSTGGNLKNNRMISVRCQGKPFSITVIQVYAPNTNA